jgi:hypothetical protein
MHLSEGHTTNNRQSYRQSTRLMQKIKKDLNKLENEFLTIEEFCTYSGIKYEQVTHLIFG